MALVTIGMLVLWGTLPFEPKLSKARSSEHPLASGTVVLEKARQVTGFATVQILWVSEEWRAAAADAQLEIDPDGSMTLVTTVATKMRSLFEPIDKPEQARVDLT